MEKPSMAENDRRSGSLLLPGSAAAGKITPLKLAISAHVHPGMSIHVSDISAHPMAAILELVRQFWGLDPRFTLITPGVYNQTVPLLIGGCVQKIIHSFAGDIYPTPGPNKVFQDFLKRGEVAIERWSMFSLLQRLAAGAMNVGYLPIRSLVGSDMAIENSDDFKVVEDPFEAGQSMGVVKALCPDITLVHGIMGDPDGNTIISPLSVTAVPGVFASKGGAIVTVEKIVPNEVLRKYSHMVSIPGFMVKSISEVPFGSHPWGMITHGVKEVEGYDHDYELFTLGRKATEHLGELEKYIKEWILDPQCYEEYLARIGTTRLNTLKKNYREIAEKEILPLDIPTGRKGSLSFTPQEIRIYSVTMKIAKIIREKKYPFITAGIGIGNLAGWIARELLKREGIQTEMAVDTGIFAYQPPIGDPFILSMRNALTATILSGVSAFYTHYCQKGRGRSLGILGAGQVDRFGNLNSTYIPPDIFLPGSGGANDIVSYSDEVLISMPQSKRRMVERVPYITCPGDNVKTLISDFGVFEKLSGEKEFTLTEYFRHSQEQEKDERQCVAEIQEKCGWQLKVASGLKAIKKVPNDFMTVLDAFDPQHFFRKGAY